MANYGLRTLQILNYLMEKTDVDHTVTTAEILSYLVSIGIDTRRQTVYSDINDLKEAGFSIETIRDAHSRYYYSKDYFELPEIKMLVDVVQASPFLSPNESLKLIAKLATLVRQNDASELKRHVYVLNRPRTINEDLYQIVDGINRAINENKQISFFYFDYTVDGEKAYRHEKRRYTINPVALCVDRYYYLVAFDESMQDYRHYRLDRMEDVQVESNARCRLPNHFDLGSYVKTIFDMYNGENVNVQMRFDKKLLNNVIDRFGIQSMMHEDGKDFFTITANVDMGPTFFGWISQFGTQAEILAPENVRQAFLNHIESIQKRYS